MPKTSLRKVTSGEPCLKKLELVEGDVVLPEEEFYCNDGGDWEKERRGGVVQVGGGGGFRMLWKPVRCVREVYAYDKGEVGGVLGS